MIGALLGLGVALVISLGGLGLPEPGPRLFVLVAAQFTGQLAAGYMGGRFAHRGRILHGSYAALGLYLVTTSVSLAAGASPGTLTLGLFALVAAVLGAAGGVLARHRAG